jgi:hypothetical protein
MFWYWVGLVLVVVLALAAWSSIRSKRLRGTTDVTSNGAFNGPREGLSRTDVGRAQAEINSTRGDRHPGGGF